MKTKNIFPFFLFAFIFFSFQQCAAQKEGNWTKDQLIEPADLAQTLQANKAIPVIYCVGPGVVIPHSIDIGATSEENNLQRFKAALEKIPRATNIVIYCGCCPFEHCPNVRPAISVLKEMNFTNYHLLNLPNNIKKDWIAKGYPEVKD
ncbi:MAG: rhodanese-like domain-containing protein [Ginsengibacter sp.]